MSEGSNEYVLSAAKDHRVKFIRLWFTDILGLLKSVAIPVEQLEWPWKRASDSMAHR